MGQCLYFNTAQGPLGLPGRPGDPGEKGDPGMPGLIVSTIDELKDDFIFNNGEFLFCSISQWKSCLCWTMIMLEGNLWFYFLRRAIMERKVTKESRYVCIHCHLSPLLMGMSFVCSWMMLSEHSSVSFTISHLHNLLSPCDYIQILICSVIKFGFCVCHAPMMLLFLLCAANPNSV